jgi:hypothetical protein
MAHRRKLIPVMRLTMLPDTCVERATLEATLRKILTPKFFWIFIACAFALVSARAAEPFQAAAPSADQQPTACGAQSYCYDTPHFAATVTSFRTSTVNGYKLIDTSVRFLNKTNQPLILGYVTASGFATDDRGNRSAVGGPNGYRGIGLVVGNNFDPKMIVRPGGSSEAQFELVLQGFPQIVGFHYVLDLTLAEIKTLEGNQHMLDGEFPLHFEGLANGVSQGAGSFAGAPDGLASAVSNLKSLFGKKKAVQNAASAANSAANAAAAVNSAANSASGQSSSAAAVNTLGQAASSSTPAPQVSGTSTPNGAPASAPVGASQTLPAQRPQGSARVAPQQVATAQPAAEIPNKPGASSAEPWTPPANGSPAASRVAPIKLEPEKMPDVIGVHLGMDPKEAMAIMRSHYPKNRPTSYDTSNLAAFPGPVFQGSYINPVNNQDDNFVFYATLPPEKQLVYKVNRITKAMHINRQTLLAALRAKYGKESAAFGTDRNTPTSNDAEINLMLWLFDESGHHVPLSNSNARTALECQAVGPSGVGSSYLMDEAYGTNNNAPLISGNPWCKSSYVGVSAEFAVGPIIEMVITDMMDLPLAVRTSHSTAVWYRAQAERARQQDLEKSKQVKPVF